MNTKKHNEPKTAEMVSREEHLRLAADFDNYRKQIEGEQGRLAQAVVDGKHSVILDILDALDTLEIARGHGEWTEGLEKAAAAFTGALERHGLTRIETGGATFDPTTMEAVGMVTGGESQTVQSEQRAGWRMNETVIRPARVVIYQ